jgi:cytochrome P450
MLIPKGSTILIPIWAIHHSDRLGYDDPETFNPDRFLTHPRLANDYAGSPDYNQRDMCPSPRRSLLVRLLTVNGSPHHYGYGAGRRMCPGIHLAERNQWRMVSKLLWAFEISEPIDPQTGQKIPLDPDAYEMGLLHAPLPFKASIRVRSPEHVKTIQREMEKAKETFLPWE